MPAFTARFATDEEIARWDELVLANPGGGNLLQSEAFIAVKRQRGWAPRYLVLESAEVTSACLVLEKAVPLLGSLWYLIKGPDVGDAAAVVDALDAVRDLVHREKLRVFAVKIEPDLVKTPETVSVFAAAGLVKTGNIQSNDSTALLDLRGTEQELFRRLSSRGRNAIRRAEREGCEVTFAEPGPEAYRQLFDLMVATVSAKGSMPLRDYAYYEQFWSEFARRGQAHIAFAHENGRPSVGAFAVGYGTKGTYKDGGSLQERSIYGDSHFVQWAMIRRLKDLGCVEYDFCGAPPADRVKDRSHPLYGVGLFKTSFTKTVTDFVGCYDLALRPRAYSAWQRGGERVARRLHALRSSDQYY
ncbi:hypothetical protein GCM10011512_15920 [Tersicoccus solisilvae]|uniref:BioF2-like acetyltransferase domain-containing protein n=1 Tax=Tersicoccus solisilvae TaxID=1882339 RepID=A0ABQ1P2Z2_9MICC|nr:peptidoglycan bridge formation glycyltransferase FemA/FemB family protein [Tersicoccus solisilvae]GGC89778.1 hypothetical protein GCM10011512_15920 [Tersicoccus solisilvae]